MQIEHYPGSRDFSWLFVPVPIAEYRGEVSRMDQNDGARAFLIRGENWDLDLSGSLLPGLRFVADAARDGMPDLPWVFNLGPQLVHPFTKHFQWRLGLFQSIATQDFKTYQLSGEVLDTRFVFLNESLENRGRLHYRRGDYVALAFQGASQEFNAIYYDVAPAFATPLRPAYNAKAGLLFAELSAYETFSSGLSTLYAGLYFNNYDFSTNHQSPLLQAGHNTTFFVAFGYTFSRSDKPSVDMDQTEGLIDRYRERLER